LLHLLHWAKFATIGAPVYSRALSDEYYGWGSDMTPKAITLATLTVLMATDASAQAIGTQSWAPNLSGIYRCVRNCAGGGLGHITAYGWNLTLTNEVGQTTRAWIDVPGHIWIPALNEGAVYSPDGFTIQFNSGTVWVLLEPQPIPGTAGF
jgi:hypothetical protein